MELTVTTDPKITEAMQAALKKIVENSEPILFAGASSIMALVHDRIHGDGKRADGSPLGTYSNSYLKFRMRKHNRTSSVNVIASLTRQMESDFTIISIDNRVGLGFQNNHNGYKAGWIEGMYPGTYLISKQEETVFENVISQYISDLFE